MSEPGPMSLSEFGAALWNELEQGYLRQRFPARNVFVPITVREPMAVRRDNHTVYVETMIERAVNTGGRRFSASEVAAEIVTELERSMPKATRAERGLIEAALEQAREPMSYLAWTPKLIAAADAVIRERAPKPRFVVGCETAASVGPHRPKWIVRDTHFGGDAKAFVCECDSEARAAQVCKALELALGEKS